MAMSGDQSNRLLRALAGEPLEQPAWWLMRQAGRYLPEYRRLRAKAASFVDFCLNPWLAAEATLQPVRRFGMDAAILFADILLVPQALGQRLDFTETGPVLEPVDTAAALMSLNLRGLGRLDAVFETVRRCRADLPANTALIGFAGAPWTVATYMVEGGTSRDFHAVRSWAYRDPAAFASLIELITEATITYLSEQAAAGAEVLQLFDRWAGVLPEAEFARWVIAPTSRIAGALKTRFPDTPLIGFPRGAGLLYERYVNETKMTAVGLDTTVPLRFARDHLQTGLPVQGNLDPAALAVGGAVLERGVREIRKALGNGPFVFNLGHGVLPGTPPDNVAALAQLLAEPMARG